MIRTTSYVREKLFVFTFKVSSIIKMDCEPPKHLFHRYQVLDFYTLLGQQIKILYAALHSESMDIGNAVICRLLWRQWSVFSTLGIKILVYGVFCIESGVILAF